MALHELVVIPENGVGVVVLGRVEPESMSHLPIPGSVLKHIGLNDVRLSGSVP